MDQTKSSAHLLLGLELNGGWKVVRAAPISVVATGGHFSVGYIVEHPDGRRGFLKALDYSAALQSDDAARALEAMTSAYNYERDVLAKCRESGMDRIVVALADGSVRVDGGSDGGVVQYLIFELAEGDIRSQADASQRFDTALSLRALHHIATGLQQLHSNGIAHQDIKPSNVLTFKGRISKVADLGRSAYEGHVSPFEELEIVGDRTYAPPELLYGEVSPDRVRRRFGGDAYLMGSMVVFFFLGVGITPLLVRTLPEGQRWREWSGAYRDALPYVRHAFDTVVGEFERALHPDLRSALVPVVRQLCEPDPLLRGHPKNRGAFGNPYSMERYVSLFNRLALGAELGVICRRD